MNSEKAGSRKIRREVEQIFFLLWPLVCCLGITQPFVFTLSDRNYVITAHHYLSLWQKGKLEDT